MAQNEHKKVLQELSEAYAQVNEGHAGPVDPKYYGLEKEFNELENKRERARDRGREAEDKGDWDEWNRQENEREGAKDALREIEDPEDYWTPKGLEVGRRVTYETSKGNQSTGKVLEIGQDVVKIRDELAGEEKEILIKDILKVESELGEGPEVPPGHPLR